jgi:hypothetical protein
MMLMDLHSLLMSLDAIKRTYTHEMAKLESSKKASYKDKKERKHPGTKSMARVPKKDCFEKCYNLCKKHGVASTMHNTKDCHRYEKTERRNLISVPL